MEGDDQQAPNTAPVPTGEQALSAVARESNEDQQFISGPHNSVNPGQYSYEKSSMEMSVGPLPPPSMLGRYSPEFQAFILEEARLESEHAREMNRENVAYRASVLAANERADISEMELLKEHTHCDYKLKSRGLLLAFALVIALISALVAAAILAKTELMFGICVAISVLGTALIGGRGLARQLKAENIIKQLGNEPKVHPEEDPK